MAEDFGGFGRRAASTAAKTGLGFWGWMVGLLGTPFLLGVVLIAGLLFLAAIIGGSGDSDDAGITASETTCQADGDSHIPKEYRDDVAQAAKQSGFPAANIASQLDNESGWRTHAVSPVGARGVAQFMPDTWKEVMGDADPFDPHKGIEAQGKYMGQLRKQMKKHFKLKDDDPRLVDYTLAAYNAGPGAVYEHNGVPPYQDTIAYVKLIKSMAQNKYSKSCKIVTVSDDAPASKSGPGDWTNPLPGSYITSGFGYRGSYKCGNGMTFHEGVDIAGGGEKYFYAPTDMTITAVHQSGTGNTTAESVFGAYIYGKQDGGEGYGFEFHENKPGSLRVKVGDKVKKGTPLGEVGQSGTGSSGVHVHFQIDKPGTNMSPNQINNCHGIDPIPILKSKGAWK